MYSHNPLSKTCLVKKDFLLCLSGSTLAQFYQISIVHYKFWMQIIWIQFKAFYDCMDLAELN